MLQMATSLGRNGLQDWIIQRASATILAAYIFFMLGFFILNTPIDQTKWMNLFVPLWCKILHLIVLMSLLLHAWIGFWNISTDYLKPAQIRLPIQVFIFFGLFSLLGWGISIIWSV